MPTSTRAPLTRTPGRDLAMLKDAERRLTARLVSFFAATARHASRQILERLGKSIESIGPTMKPDWLGVDDEQPTVTQTDADYVAHPVDGEQCNGCVMFRPRGRCTLVEGTIAPDGHCQFWEPNIKKSSDHPDFHVQPENAEPIHGIPVADVVTRANVQHVSWEMVREGKTRTVRRSVPMDSLIATQEVVDRQRVLKHMGELRATGKTEATQPPLVLLWDDDYFILGGHHGLQAAYDLGVPTVLVDIMEAP